MQRALITGITGQDGSYLAEFLLAKGYEVHGIIRRASTFNTHRLDHIYIDPHEPNAHFFLHYGDLSDPGLITEIIYNIRPNEVYHLGAQSHVKVSFDMPEYTGDITGLGTTRILEAIRRSGIKTKFYQASSSEMFGSAPPPQHEQTVFQPRSPYAIAKVYSYWMVVNYRLAYGLHTSNGILFNHESPRRGEIFVTRKITRGIASLLSGKQSCLFLGNLDAKRDWGFAPEYVEVMWKIVQEPIGDDYVVGTGVSHSVREFAERAFAYAGVELEWKNKGEDEVGLVKSYESKWDGVLMNGMRVVAIDPRYYRPTEVDALQADITKARVRLGWEPRVTFEELIQIMMDYDMLTAGLPAPSKGIQAVSKRGINWTNHQFLLHNHIRQTIG